MTARDGWDRAREVLARLDPARHADAEPVSAAFVVCFAIALIASGACYFGFYQPLVDVPHHIAAAAVVADYGRPGSIYPALYEPLDVLSANSLLYSVVGLAGRVAGVERAMTASIALYVLGVPLAVLWSLRAFGRSPWGAVLAVPLVYGMNYLGGFANMLVAAPFFVLAIPVFHRALVAPSLPRILQAAALFVVVFLLHGHVYLWLGVLTIGTTLVIAASRLLQDPRAAGRVLIHALLAALPSLLLFARWYRRIFSAGREAGSNLTSMTGVEGGFGATFHDPPTLFRDLGEVALRTLQDGRDLRWVAAVACLAVVATSLSRGARSSGPPVLELCFVATFASYFVLPESIKGQDIIGPRQVGLSLFFLPVFVSPPSRASRGARALVVAGILLVTGAHLTMWRRALARMEREEHRGLDDVLAAAPPRLPLHYVKVAPKGAIFAGSTWWHVEKLYMARGFGYCADTIGTLANAPLRFRPGLDLKRYAIHGHDWPHHPELFAGYDLVLVRRWRPSPRDLARAEEQARRIARSGDWELWRRRGAWETAAP